MTNIAIPGSLRPFSLAIQMMLGEEGEQHPWKADVIAARRGSQSAFASLVRSVQRPVYGLCLRLLSSDAEASEAAQEAFLRAYQHLNRYNEQKPFDLWVLAIARNLCLDILRRRAKMRSEDVDEMRDVLPSSAKSQEEGAIAREERLSLHVQLAGARDRACPHLFRPIRVARAWQRRLRAPQSAGAERS